MKDLGEINYPVKEIFSHPNIPLARHLLETANNIKTLYNPFRIQALVEEHKIHTMCILTGALHDIGKATSYFQDYIKKKRYRKNDPIKKHAPLGSVYAYWVILNSSLIEDEQMRAFFAFIVSTVIAKHHGNLQDIRDERKGLKGRFQDLMKQDNILRKQLDDTIQNTQKIDQILSFLSSSLNIPLPSWTSFTDTVLTQPDVIKKSFRKVSKTIEGYEFSCQGQENKKTKKVKGTEFKPTLVLQYMFSLLQEADKTEAMGKEVVARSQKDYHSDLKDAYEKMFAHPSRELDKERLKIFQEACMHASTCDLQERIYALEAPTGAAKTLASLGWATRLRKRLSDGYRIIYILPFTSVVDQNFNVIREMLFAGKTEVPSNELLMHHHSADLKYQKEENGNLEEEQPNVAQFYIESWASEIIVSTFYQFFHSLFTNNKKSLRKFSKLSKAIIIMDEVQAIPIKYWHLFDRVIPILLENLDSYLLLSTATLPGIVSKTPPSISQTGKKLFGHFERTELYWLDKEFEPHQLFEELEKNIDFSTLLSFLIVLNTVASSQEVFKIAKERFADWKVHYLSAAVVPLDRKRRIVEIKKQLDEIKEDLDTGKRVMLVSTQVIEAGVDLSFEAGFRDLAPLDSIIQTAGRINRSGEYGGGKLYISKLVKIYENGTKRKLASFIYDPILLQVTEDTLTGFANGKPIPEPKYRNMVDRYFKIAKQKEGTEESRKVTEFFCKMELSNVQRQFQLIDNEYSFPLFIELDESASTILGSYRKLGEIRREDWKLARNEYARIKGKMADYLINVSFRKIAAIKKDLEEESWFFILPLHQVSNYYSQDAGFTVNQGEENVW